MRFFWIQVGLASVAITGDSAYALDMDEWVGVVGLSAGGEQYALCRALGWNESAMRDECQGFLATVKKTDEDEGIYRRTIYLCRTVADPTAESGTVSRLCEKSWSLSNDKTLVKKTESELKASGLRLAGSVRHLIVSSHSQFQVPREIMKRYGVDAVVVGAWASEAVGDKGEGDADCCLSQWHMRFRAKGFGTVSIRQGRGRHGVWDYKLGSVSVSHDTPWLFYNVGVVAEEAAYKLPWAIRLDHVAARLFNSRGYRKHKGGDFSGSARDFGRALALNPEYAQAAFNAACAESRLGNEQRSLDLLDAAIKLQPALFKRKAKADRDLDAVRNDERFKALVAP